MKRTSIYLTEPQRTEFEKRAKMIGIKTAELIRRALDDYLERTKSPEHIREAELALAMVSRVRKQKQQTKG